MPDRDAGLPVLPPYARGSRERKTSLRFWSTSMSSFSHMSSSVPRRGACEPSPGLPSSRNGSFDAVAEPVEQLRLRGYGDVEGLEAEAAGDEHHVARGCRSGCSTRVSVVDEVDRDRLRERLPVARGRRRVESRACRPRSRCGAPCRCGREPRRSCTDQVAVGEDLPAPVAILRRRCLMRPPSRATRQRAHTGIVR